MVAAAFGFSPTMRRRRPKRVLKRTIQPTMTTATITRKLTDCWARMGPMTGMGAKKSRVVEMEATWGVEPLLFQMSCISRVVTARASRFSPMPLMTWLTL